MPTVKYGYIHTRNLKTCARKGLAALSNYAFFFRSGQSHRNSKYVVGKPLNEIMRVKKIACRHETLEST